MKTVSLSNKPTRRQPTVYNRQVAEVMALKHKNLHTNRICLPHLSLSTIRVRASIEKSTPLTRKHTLHRTIHKIVTLSGQIMSVMSLEIEKGKKEEIKRRPEVPQPIFL